MWLRRNKNLDLKKGNLAAAEGRWRVQSRSEEGRPNY